jgi:hypothetical protein
MASPSPVAAAAAAIGMIDHYYYTMSCGVRDDGEGVADIIGETSLCKCHIGRKLLLFPSNGEAAGRLQFPLRRLAPILTRC